MGGPGRGDHGETPIWCTQGGTIAETIWGVSGLKILLMLVRVYISCLLLKLGGACNLN